MAKIGGTAFFKIDGGNFSTNGEFEIMIQDVVREAVPDSNGDVNSIERPVASKISGSINMIPDLDPAAITAMENVTVAVELNNGKIAVLAEAFFTGESTATVNDGQLAIEFHGKGRWDK